jgi:membrane protease YdiL (CAAX protease family)
MRWLPHLLALLVVGPTLADRWLFSPRGTDRMGLYLRIAAWQAGASALLLLAAGPPALWCAPRAVLPRWAAAAAVLAAVLFLGGIILSLLRTRARGRPPAGAFWPKTHRERIGWALVAVASGIGEELMFRGYLLRYLHVAPWQVDLIWAVLISCLLFGLGHLYQGIAAAARAGLAGLFFFGLFLGSGSLLLPIATHLAADLAGLLPSAWRRGR